MNSQKGIIHLLPLLAIAAVIIIAVVLVVKGNIFKKTQTSKEPTIELKSEYQNPFDKNSQYVNPFDQYKSPFLTVKK